MGNPLTFEDSHVYYPEEVHRHTLFGGPGNCRCEPSVEFHYVRGGVVHRIILHQKLAQTDRFYEEYFGGKNGQ
jgi:hypothetical protein